MQARYFHLVVLAAGLLLGFATSAHAQTGGIEGTVTVKQADGTQSPAANVLVELYRLDIRGQYSTKSDKNGRFAHIGLPIGNYAILLSGPGYNPYYEMNVRIAPGEPIRKTYDLIPGDGRKLNIDEVRQATAQSQQAKPGAGSPPKMSQEEVRKLQEQQVKVQEEQKKKAAADEEMIKHFNAGKQLATSNQYDQAIAEYKQAVEASPDHPSIYVVLANMAQSYFNLGVERNNNRQRESAIEAIALAAETMKKAADQAAKPEEKPEYYRLYAHYCSQLSRLEPTKPARVETAIAAYQQLATVQTAQADKLATQNAIGDVYLNANRTPDAIGAYRKTLESDAANLDALHGLGLALVQTAEEAKYNEAIEVLTKFKDLAAKQQARSQQVADADSIIAALKESMQPQKKAAPARRRP